MYFFFLYIRIDTFKYIRENFATVDIFINNAPNNEGVEDMIDTHMVSPEINVNYTYEYDNIIVLKHGHPTLFVFNFITTFKKSYLSLKNT